MEDINKSDNKLYSRTIYYRIEEYSVCEVWRDDIWWENNKIKFIEFWEKVEKYRKEGYESLIVPKKKIVRKKKSLNVSYYQKLVKINRCYFLY